MPVDARADIDSDGFGGHTALVGCVVTAPGMHHDDKLARLLLERFHEQGFVNEAAMNLLAERGGRSS